MLVRRSVLLFCLLAFTNLGTTMSWAQSVATGRIVGSVCDQLGHPLDFANVIVMGTTMGAMARNGGKFQIDLVPVGHYQLKATFVGHEPQVREVDVRASCTTTVSFCGEAPEASKVRTITALAEPGTGELRVIDAEGEAVSSLPLRHTRIEARVSGPATHVLVEQTFHNPFDRPIESIYVFPLPHDAAVNLMEVRIGARILRANIRKRQVAVQLYEDARREGRVAVLLEQERANIFTQQVTNIMPGHEIVVRIRYHQNLQYDAGYELVVPTVVGPRFIPGAPLASTAVPVSTQGVPLSHSERDLGQESQQEHRSGKGWSNDTDEVPDASRITPRVLAPGAESNHRIDIVVKLDAGIPIETIESINHAVEVRRDGKQRAEIRLRSSDTIPNKDFVLRYAVEDDRLRFGVVAHRDADAQFGYLTLLMQPSAKPREYEIPPIDLVLVLDVSGSMKGAPIETSKGIVRWLLQRLRSTDRLSMIQFSNQPRYVQDPGQLASTKNVQAALRNLDGLRGSGGTQMQPAVQMALDLAPDEERLRIVCLLTDAFVGNEDALMRSVHERLGKARLFVIGIGSSPNRLLVDGLAREGLGATDYVSVDEDPRRAVDRFFMRIENPVLEDIQIDWGRLEVQDVHPDDIPPLFFGRPLQIIARYRGSGHDEIVVRGKRDNQPFEQRVRVRLPGDQPTNGELVTLWARRRVQDLSRNVRHGDLESTRKIQQLGLEHSLMTRYTAFIATDNQVMNTEGMPTLVPQPVEMPLGVRHEGIFGAGSRGLHKGVAGMTQSVSITNASARVGVKASDVSHVQTESAAALGVGDGIPNTEVSQSGELHVRGGRTGDVRTKDEPVAPTIEVHARRVTVKETSATLPTKETVAVGVPQLPEVTLELVLDSVKRGAPVQMRLIVENTTDHAVQIPQQLALELGTFAVSVTFEEIALSKPRRSQTQATGSETLAQGVTRTYVVTLNDVEGYAFTRTGIYKIRVEQIWGLNLTSPRREWTLSVH